MTTFSTDLSAVSLFKFPSIPKNFPENIIEDVSHFFWKPPETPPSFAERWKTLISEKTEQDFEIRAQIDERNKIITWIFLTAVTIGCILLPFYREGYELITHMMILPAAFNLLMDSGIYFDNLARGNRAIATHTKNVRTHYGDGTNGTIDSDWFSGREIKNTNIAPMVCSHILSQKDQIEELKTALKTAETNLHLPNLRDFLDNLSSSLSDKGIPSQFTTILQEALNKYNVEDDEKYPENIKIQCLISICNQFEAEIKKLQKEDPAIVSLEQTLETAKEKLISWKEIAAVSASARTNNIYNLKQKILTEKVSLIFLHTFLVQEDGAAKFEQAVEEHAIHPERALFDIAKRHEMSQDNYNAAKLNGLVQASQVFNLEKNTKSKNWQDMQITESEIEDEGQWTKILDKLVWTAPPTESS